MHGVHKGPNLKEGTMDIYRMIRTNYGAGT